MTMDKTPSHLNDHSSNRMAYDPSVSDRVSWRYLGTNPA
ncbi:hypothetical protein LBBP_01678 [Leptospira borgpetersenii serovar Ballum]|uniref:Uncharacterized protein n=1 Tax=Leptospira borgpetersenii serovar Ballum TaxID=280505 RepID=A0A0S2IR84_LEPBO|nr:hypothetical protein LBBP_01678 [Leptospira borgpetersenii serovar Ballum]